MGDIVIGLLIGLAASLVAWWLVTRAVAPKLDVSSEISKLPDESVPGRWRYRIKVVNLRRWLLLHGPAVDVRIVASLRLKGFDGYQGWTDFPIPIAHTGELDMIERNALPRLRLYDMNAAHLQRLLGEQAFGKDTSHIALEDLLSLGEDSEIRVIVSAAHPYTGARRAVIGRYSLADITCGAFWARPGRRGLQVARAPSRCREESMRAADASNRLADPPSPVQRDASSTYLFQYGSNMSEQRLSTGIRRHARFAPRGTPLDVHLVGPARLQGWSLVFDLYSSVQRCLVADMIETQMSDEVWGGLYELDPQLVMRADQARSVLDRIEGRQTERDPENYQLIRVEVDVRGTSRSAFTYVGTDEARRRCKTEHPEAELCADYVAAITEGARALSLPAEYIRAVEMTIAKHRVGSP
jgi:gamma-glutamylcyclotransferase (GGCT)/AIG2-like uncharacterized protein YtfP